MCRILATAGLGLALFAGLAADVSAQGDARSERACVGAYVGGNARAGGSAFGATVSGEVKVFRPFGQTTVSPSATTCELPG